MNNVSSQDNPTLISKVLRKLSTVRRMQLHSSYPALVFLLAQPLRRCTPHKVAPVNYL